MKFSEILKNEICITVRDYVNNHFKQRSVLNDQNSFAQQRKNKRIDCFFIIIIFLVFIFEKHPTFISNSNFLFFVFSKIFAHSENCFFLSNLLLNNDSTNFQEFLSNDFSINYYQTIRQFIHLPFWFFFWFFSDFFFFSIFPPFAKPGNVFSCQHKQHYNSNFFRSFVCHGKSYIVVKATFLRLLILPF